MGTPGPNMTKKTASQGASRDGGPEPQIEVRLPRGASFRSVNVVLHELAVEVELFTPKGEHWIVQIENSYDGRGRVYLELADGTPGEAERAMAVLRKVVG